MPSSVSARRFGAHRRLRALIVGACCSPTPPTPSRRPATPAPSARCPGCARPSPASPRARPTPAAARSSRRCWPSSTRRDAARRAARAARPRRHRGPAPPPRRPTSRSPISRSRCSPPPLASRARDVAAAVDAVRVVAARLPPRTDAPGADAALARLLGAAPARRARGRGAARRAARPGVRGDRGARPRRALGRSTRCCATSRRCPRPAGSGRDGRIVVVRLDGHPFGAGPRACPGEAHARALAAGVVEGAR